MQGGAAGPPPLLLSRGHDGDKQSPTSIPTAGKWEGPGLQRGGEKITLEAPSPTLPFMAAPSDPSLMQEFARGRQRGARQKKRSQEGKGKEKAFKKGGKGS